MLLIRVAAAMAKTFANNMNAMFIHPNFPVENNMAAAPAGG